MWVLGLSYRGIEGLLEVFRIRIGRMTAWRDVQGWAEQLRQRRQWKPVRVLGIDGAYVRAMGAIRPVMVAVDLGDGQPVAISYVEEYKPQALRKLLEPLVKQLGVSVIVSDEQDRGRQVGSGTSNLPVSCAALGRTHPQGTPTKAAGEVVGGARRSWNHLPRTAGRRQSPLIGAVETDRRTAFPVRPTELARGPIAQLADPPE